MAPATSVTVLDTHAAPRAETSSAVLVEPSQAMPGSRRARRLAFATSESVTPTPDMASAVLTSSDAADSASDAPRRDVPTAPQVTSVTSSTDAFSLASDAFGFVNVDSAPSVDVSRPAAVPALHIPARRTRGRIAAAAATIGVMGIAGLIAVSMTVPASAVAAVQSRSADASASLVAAAPQASKKASDDEIQAFVASGGVQDEPIVHDAEYSSVSLLDVAAEENIRFSNSLYTNDPNAAIQWPFMVGVAMSSPYGMRNGRMHAGIDLVPGAGATIQAIADGTVRIATESGGAYGVTVYIDHVIDGQTVTSHYAHMQYGSLAVKAGQKVHVGDTVGKVGNTGRSYGAHLHFEIIINGATVDPLVWMRKNAGRNSY